MAIQIQQSAGGRGRSRYAAPMAEINIIPLVDVVLVLLIIFMLTAHVMEFGLDIQVPKVDARNTSTEDLAIINITKDAKLYLGDRPATLVDMPADIRKRFPSQKAVYVRADRDTPWNPIAQVISVLGKAKIEVRMITEPKE